MHIAGSLAKSAGGNNIGACCIGSVHLRSPCTSTGLAADLRGDTPTRSLHSLPSIQAVSDFSLLFFRTTRCLHQGDMHWLSHSQGRTQWLTIDRSFSRHTKLQLTIFRDEQMKHWAAAAHRRGGFECHNRSRGQQNKTSHPPYWSA